MKKVETINDEKTLTISEDEFYDVMTQVTAAYVSFQMDINGEEDLNLRMQFAQDYGLLTFVLKEVLFENGDLKHFFEKDSDYSEEEE